MPSALVQHTTQGCNRGHAFGASKCSQRPGMLRMPRHLLPFAARHNQAAPSRLEEKTTTVAAPPPLHLNEVIDEVHNAPNPIVGWMTSLQSPSRLQGLVMLNVMTLLMGSNWVVVKSAEESMDPFLFSALRFTMAAIALSPALPAAMKEPEVVKAGVELGLYSVLGYLAQSQALFYTDASRASLLSTFTVLAVPLIARMTGRKVKPIVWICGVGTMIGTAMLEQSGTPPNWGDAFAVGSAIFFALQMFRTEVLTRKLKTTSPFPLASVSLGTIALAASAVAGVHFLPQNLVSNQIADLTTHGTQLWNQITHVGQPPPPPPSTLAQIKDQISHLPAQLSLITSQIGIEIADLPARISQLPAHLVAHPAAHHPLADAPEVLPAIQYIRSLPWGALLYTSMCSTNLVILIEMLALHTVSSTEAAMIYTLEPVEGALLAYWLLGERWGMLGWVGAGIIITCALATQIGGGGDTPAEGEAAK